MLDVLMATLGGLALALGLASGPLRRLPLSEPLAALVLGVVIGPQLFGVVTLPAEETVHILHVAARIALAISLMAVALRFPLGDYLDSLRPIVVLITAVLVLMAAVGAGLGMMVLGLPVAVACLLGAALSPTDPVLASSVVSGGPAKEQLPARLRAIISGESAANDTLAFPLVIVAVSAVGGRSIGGAVLSSLGRVILGAALGAAIGYVAGRLLVAVERHRDMEQSAFLVLTVTLALFALGAVTLAGGEGILGVLAAGLAYSHTISQAERREEFKVQEAVNRFLVLPVFTLLGIALPWAAWSDHGWAPVSFTIAVLLARRLPWLVLLRRPLGLSLADATFAGWFGPIGVAALFYLTSARQHVGLTELVWATGVMVIAASTLVHGVTATPGRRWYAAAATGEADQPTRSAA